MKLTCEYLEAINTGGIPTIMGSMERLMLTEVRRVQEEIRHGFYKKINEDFSEDKLPLEEEEFN